MAARLRVRHQDDIRLKIGAAMIASRLEKHVEGLIELSPTQIQAAKILLDKTISNAPTDTTLSGAVTFELKAPWMQDIAKQRGWA